ncbi:MAG: flagellar hook-length control protein FliK [Lachnospiraceae bacterium]|nr:flagellar hook-length control protein FliK [Lachnospiraceae bacterium]
MTNMPVLDKGSGVQNILSTKGTKPAQASEKGTFDTVLRQTTEAGRQNTDPGKKTDTVKNAEKKTDDTASKNDVNESEKAEEKAGTDKTETQTKAEESKDISEDLAEDTETLERAGGEMVAALAAQMGIPEDIVRDAMDELGMSDLSLLDGKNVKDLMVYLTDGADDMSLLTDEAFYNSVTEALGTLKDVTDKLQEETGMSAEELRAALENAGQKLSANVEEVPEEVAEVSGNEIAKETESEQDIAKINMQKPELSENARTETVTMTVKDAPKQENTGSNENQFMGDGYGTQNLQQTQDVQAARTQSTFSVTDTQEIMDQILDYMKVSVKPEMTSLEMQLHPESLGTLHIQITNREGAVTAQFIAQNESVRAVLESQVMELKENLEQQGLKVEAVEVTIAQYSLDRNPDGNEASSEQGRQGRKGSRNLNLGELDLEEEEDLTEEERLTAKMMQSEGNTVNYTA